MIFASYRPFIVTDRRRVEKMWAQYSFSISQLKQSQLNVPIFKVTTKNWSVYFLGSLILPKKESRRFWLQEQMSYWPLEALTTCVWSTLWTQEPWPWGGFLRGTSNASLRQLEVRMEYNWGLYIDSFLYLRLNVTFFKFILSHCLPLSVQPGGRGNLWDHHARSGWRGCTGAHLRWWAHLGQEVRTN